jgi:hypothetical protein
MDLRMEEELPHGISLYGPALWRLLHSYATTYHPRQKNTFIMLMKNSIELMPCGQCKVEAVKELNNLIKSDALENNLKLFKWMYDYHDRINKYVNESFPYATPKISPPYENIKKMYFESLGIRQDIAYGDKNYYTHEL